MQEPGDDKATIDEKKEICGPVYVEPKWTDVDTTVDLDGTTHDEDDD